MTTKFLMYYFTAFLNPNSGVEVGYTFPKAWFESLYVKSLRVYVSGNNLFCISKFKLWDPELGTNDGLKYPMNRSIMFGMDLNF